MPRRERNLRIHIMVNDNESTAIRERMKELVTQNQSVFIRKMVIDGC